jgi:hypothetical protein
MRHPIQLHYYIIWVKPHGILHVLYTILNENEFQNPQIFQQTISLFPEQSTLSSTIYTETGIFKTLHCENCRYNQDF